MRCHQFQLLIVVFVLVLGLCGCGTVQTIHPIRTSDKTKLDREIEGVWNSQPENPTIPEPPLATRVLTIKREGGKKYRVSLRDWQNTYDGHAYLVELGNRQFLEFDLESMTQQGEVIKRPDNLLGNSVNTLYFARLHRVGDSLRIGFPRLEDFQQAAQSSDDLVGFERGKSFIITSTTEQLQRFLSTADDSMYQSVDVFLRSEESPEPKTKQP